MLYALRPLVRLLNFSLDVTGWYDIESAHITLYVNVDLPRTRAHSVNYTYTPHVRFPDTVHSHEMAEKSCRTQDLWNELEAAMHAAALRVTWLRVKITRGLKLPIFSRSARQTLWVLVASILIFLTSLQWNDLNYKRFIEDDGIAAGFELNSIQQGFLCSAAEHRMFDDYSIGVNPDVRAYFVPWDMLDDTFSVGQLPHLWLCGSRPQPFTAWENILSKSECATKVSSFSGSSAGPFSSVCPSACQRCRRKRWTSEAFWPRYWSWSRRLQSFNK